MYAPNRAVPAPCAPGLLSRALLVALLLVCPLLVAPAGAAERVVTITTDGVSPGSVQVAPNDTVTFFAATRVLGGYRLESTGGPWTFAGRAGDLLGSDRFTVPQALVAPGTYTYRASGGGKVFQGSVVVPAPPPPPPAAAVPGKPGAPPPARPGAPPPAGGTGSTALPPLAGGFGAVQQPGPLPGPALAQAPALAAPVLPPDVNGPLVAPPPTTALALAPTAVAGNLPGQPTMRPFGLPSALAVVLAGGVLSLLVRAVTAGAVSRPPRSRPGSAAD